MNIDANEVIRILGTKIAEVTTENALLMAELNALRLKVEAEKEKDKEGENGKRNTATEHKTKAD